MIKVGKTYDVYKWEHQKIGETLIPLADNSYLVMAHSQLGRSGILTRKFDADFMEIGEETKVDNDFKIPNQSGFLNGEGLQIITNL